MPPAPPGPHGRRQRGSAHHARPNFSSQLLRGIKGSVPTPAPVASGVGRVLRQKAAAPGKSSLPAFSMPFTLTGQRSCCKPRSSLLQLTPALLTSRCQPESPVVSPWERLRDTPARLNPCPRLLHQLNAQSNKLHAVLSVDTDPHFIIHVPQKEDTLCFNINEEPGVVLSLVQDPNTGMVTSHPPPDRPRPGRAPLL